MLGSTGCQSTLVGFRVFDFSKQRAAQKAKFGGEFFPSTSKADRYGRAYLEFFQQDEISGLQKGIL